MTRRQLAAAVAVLVALAGFACTPQGGDTSPDLSAASTEGRAQDYVLPAPSDFNLQYTETAHQCPGMSPALGCEIKFTIKPTYVGRLVIPQDVSLTVYYEVREATDNFRQPYTNHFTVTGIAIKADESETAYGLPGRQSAKATRVERVQSGVALKSSTLTPPLGITIAGVDAHDGMIYESAGTYYLVGTAYACGFTWGVHGTPFCGMHIYSAPALAGPWTYVRELFNRAVNSPFHNQTWASLCGDQGRGCFNPRMIRRPSDGKWILSFNAPGDLAKWGANGYYFMGCDSIAGPCGNGSATGSTVKPALYICNAAEDFSIVEDGPTGYILCVDNDRKLRLERLDACWCNGVNVGATFLAGLQFVEGEDIVFTSEGWVLIYGSNCPYCPGTDTSYAIASSILGPYTAPPWGRRRISAASCGGQSRTITQVPDGTFVFIDTWHGGNNEPTAQIRLVELRRTAAPLLPVPDGSPWDDPAFDPFVCV